VVWSAPTPPALLVVDGYEQAGWWARRWLRAHCRRVGMGLLVTAHRDMGLPGLYQTDVGPDLARAVVEGLLAEDQRGVLAGVDLGRELRRHRGSLREVLFGLYDRYEG
jgi:hypothetical protein